MTNQHFFEKEPFLKNQRVFEIFVKTSKPFIKAFKTFKTFLPKIFQTYLNSNQNQQKSLVHLLYNFAKRLFGKFMIRFLGLRDILLENSMTKICFQTLNSNENPLNFSKNALFQA